MSCVAPLRAWQERSGQPVVWKRPASPRIRQLDLPCGQCIGCRLERSRQWAVRCMHELQYHDQSCFLTLTYRDADLPDGLRLDHFQKFMKRLRKAVSPKRISFFHCGEYGDQFGRPHYHAIIFGHDFADKVLFKEASSGNLYTSQTLDELWGLGYATIGSVTFESAAYVARYCTKKVTGERAAEHYQGRRPEYATMSRRPGIGLRWIKDFMLETFKNDSVIVRGKETKPPRYYDSLLAKTDPSSFSVLKARRELDGNRLVSTRVDTPDGSRTVLLPRANSYLTTARELTILKRFRMKRR